MVSRTDTTRRASRLLPVVGVSAVVLIILAQSPRALLFLFTDGLIATAILAAASLGGLWAVALFRLGELPLRWHLLLGAGLGIGGLALLVLALGVMGLLGRVPWIVLLVFGGIAGIVRLGVLVRGFPGTTSRGPRSEGDISATLTRRGVRWLWLIVCPFAAMALLVALVPPGLLWVEEGNGHDVLEYHLQMPREYFETEQISYAPHNVYANFPANAEMLYLLSMIVQGGPLAGVTVAKLINALLAFLTVAAAWLAGRETGPIVGAVTGVLAATVGWLTYLAGIAYVENAMLFFAMLSAAAVLRAVATEGSLSMRWIIVAGVLAGLSAGCKYTAVVLIVVPLAAAVLVGHWSSHRRRLTAFAFFSASALVAFAPWMAKNLAFTSNPVFPLAGGVFRACPDGWSAERSEHFDQSHAPGADESSVGARVGMLWSKVIVDDSQRFGPVVFLLAVAGLVLNLRKRLDWQFGLVLLVQVGLWMALTHLYARFAVVFLVPLVILGGRFLDDLRTPMQKTGMALLVAGAVWNLAFATALYRKHLHTDAGYLAIEGTPEVFTAGLMPTYEHLAVINGELPDDSKVLLVGEARAFYFQRDIDYCVVFNRNSFVEAVESADRLSDTRQWFTERCYTHVYVSWSEISRLRRSRYGFPSVVTPALLDKLVSAGVLRHTRAFKSGTQDRAYAELYEVVLP